MNKPIILSLILVLTVFNGITQTFPKMDETVRLKKLAPPSGKIRAVLDTDTYNEVDDQFALAYAVLSPECGFPPRASYLQHIQHPHLPSAPANPAR